jgi:hypothetical protein
MAYNYDDYEEDDENFDEDGKEINSKKWPDDWEKRPKLPPGQYYDRNGDIIGAVKQIGTFDLSVLDKIKNKKRVSEKDFEPVYLYLNAADQVAMEAGDDIWIKYDNFIESKYDDNFYNIIMRNHLPTYLMNNCKSPSGKAFKFLSNWKEIKTQINKWLKKNDLSILQESSIKSFNNILNESKLTEAKSDGVELKDGKFVYFVKTKDGGPYHEYDLVVETSKGHKYTLRKFASYTQGYDQGFGVGNKPKWYLKCDGWNAGNGGGHEKAQTPNIKYERGLQGYIERYLDVHPVPDEYDDE